MMQRLSAMKCNTSVCGVQVLNDVVVDRGPSSYLSNVDLFLDGHLITTVQGDGERCLQLSATDVTSHRRTNGKVHFHSAPRTVEFPACVTLCF